MKITKETMVREILTHINTAYSTKTKPSTSALMALYTKIGEAIASVEESSFAKELVSIIAEECPNVKGFSLRNLCRMRDFYITFSVDADLLANAQTIGWTQNIVIMDKCQSVEEMSFYVTLVKGQSLSKAGVTVALEEKTFEASKKAKVMDKVEEINATTSKKKSSVTPDSHGKQTATTDTGGCTEVKVTAFVDVVRDFLLPLNYLPSLATQLRPRNFYWWLEDFPIQLLWSISVYPLLC